MSTNQRPWILDLTAAERSTLVATFGGWALDGMDVMVYSFVIPTLIAAWHISKGQAGLLGTAALLISAVGGWLAGLLADRFGRVRVLQITIRVVRVLHVLKRIHQLVLAIADDARTARPGVWRGVGGRLSIDGRSHPRTVPRQGRRHRARWMGHRLGHHGNLLHRTLFHTSRRNCVARDVLDRHSAGAAGVLHSAERSRARSVPQNARARGCPRGRAVVFWRSSAPRC